MKRSSQLYERCKKKKLVSNASLMKCSLPFTYSIGLLLIAAAAAAVAAVAKAPSLLYLHFQTFACSHTYNQPKHAHILICIIIH